MFTKEVSEWVRCVNIVVPMDEAKDLLVELEELKAPPVRIVRLRTRLREVTKSTKPKK